MSIQQIGELFARFRRKLGYLILVAASCVAIVYGQDIALLDVTGPPPEDDPSRHTGPWVDRDGAKDFFETIPPVYEGALEGGEVHGKAVPNEGVDIPAGGIASPLFGANPFDQQLLRFEEFGTQSMLGTTEHQQTLPPPGDPSGFPDGAALDAFLDLDGFAHIPTEFSNTDTLNPWEPIIESFLGRDVQTPPAEGRPPGEGWSHQRWNEFLPEVYVKTAQTGARPNGGMRDRLQRHGFSKGEFGPGGLYNTVYATDQDGALFVGTTNAIPVQFHPNFPVQSPTSLWTWDGTFPPKLLMGRYGEPILMRHYNALPIDPGANNGFGLHTISTHEHNGHNPAESDGFAGAFYFPGQFWDYRWPMVLAGYDTVNTTASDPRASFPADPGEQIFVNDANPGMRSEQNGRIQLRGDWRETMSTHWFHDHMIDHTAENVYKGNAAMFNYYSALDRGNEGLDDGVNLRFPSGTAAGWGNRDYDVNLVIADKAWDAEGQLYFNPFERDGFLGDRMTVNWLWNPYFNVRHRSYRFRILNGAVARYFKLALVKEVQGNGGEHQGLPGAGISYDRVGFHMIANDGNILEHTVPFDGSMDLDADGNASEHKGILPTQAIAERYDIVIDFSSQGINPGDKLYLVNMYEHADGRGPKDVIPLSDILSGNYVAEQSGGIWTNGDPAVGKILEFRVVEYTGEDLSMDPADYTPGKQKMIPLAIDRNNLGNARQRSFEFVRGGPTDDKPWAIKTDEGLQLNADTRRISAAPQMATGPTAAGFDGTNGTDFDQTGTIEQWTLSGGGGWDHPVHIHFEEGIILSKDGEFPPVWEEWARKDIYRIGPSVDSAREIKLAMRFREFAGTFVEHCHNTTHEDHAMLLRWDLEFPGQVKAMPSPVPSWDGVEYVDSVALPTFRSGLNGPELPDSNPFLSPIIDSFSGTSIDGSTALSWGINQNMGDNIIALELEPGIGSVLGRTAVAVNPTQTTIYRLRATSPGGISTATITVTPGGEVDPGDINNGGVVGDNLLTNADFENGLNDWIAESSPTGQVVATADPANGGAAVSLRGGMIHRSVPITPFSQYIFSAMYRNEGTPGMTMGIEFFDGAGTSLDFVQIDPGVSPSYRSTSIRAKAPANAVSAQISFKSDEPGTTWVDNINFAEETVVDPAEPARYRIDFTGLFNEANHPSNGFPATPNFMELFAASHDTTDGIWSENTLADDGVTQLAEIGDSSVLALLADSKIGASFGTYVRATEPINGDGSASIELSATAEHPILSLITKISPSPDWITGVNSVDLRDVDGNWKPSFEIDIFPFDVGTDSGASYESDDVVTIPQVSITPLKGLQPFSENPIGRITLTRIADGPVIRGENLLTNGGFEEGFLDWNIYTEAGGTAVLTTDSANGSFAAELSGAFIYRSVPVVELTGYSLATQYFSTGNAAIAMGIEFLDAEGNLLLFKEVTPSSNDRYLSVAASAESPAGAVEANIYFWSGRNGVTQVDDFTFQTISQIEDGGEEPNVINSLLKNGGFEKRLKSWKKRKLSGKKSRIEISNVSAEGRLSCLLSGGMVHQSVSASKRAIYSLTGSYKTLGTSPTAEVGISFLDAKGKELSSNHIILAPSGDFQNFSVQGVAPTETTMTKVYAFGGVGGELLIDDLGLSEIEGPKGIPELSGPSVSLSSNALSANHPFTVSVVFYEPVTGLDVSDFRVKNGAIKGLSQIGTSQYFMFVEAAKRNDVEIYLPAKSVVNASNQGNRESNVLSVKYFKKPGEDPGPNPDPDPVPGADPEAVPIPESLKNREVPEPTNLSEFIKDKESAIELGKALFWDMQVGSNNKTSCASCHFNAGADSRSKNQLSPGLLRVNSGREGDPDTNIEIGGVNHTLSPEDFPFHKLTDVDDRFSTIISSINDVASSQGVFLERFESLNGETEENTTTVPDDIFHINAVNTRRVEPRNTPSVINAVFNLRNFWDGRAQDKFNGVNPFGLRDRGAYVWKAEGKRKIGRVAIELNNSSLASQAVGPPLSNFEMSATGRLFPELGRKLLSRRPLSLQLVHPEDSVLGKLSRSPKQGLKESTYAELIKKAFQPEWWEGDGFLNLELDDITLESSDTMGLTTLSKKLKKESKRKQKLPGDNEFTHMEANFSLYFGLAIQLYEATLISDDTPFDKYAEGNFEALNPQQKEGMDIFFGKAKCANCHGESEFTRATVHHIKKERLESMIMGDNNVGIYDNGFYNIGVRPTLDDLGVGGVDEFGFPLSESRLVRDFGRSVFEEVIGETPNRTVEPNGRVAADGAFKTPSLRNVELTAPYFHNGGTRTLLEVVEFYNRGGDFHEQNIDDLDPDIENLNLTESEKNALVAFMKALTDERVRNRQAPFDHPQLFIPNGHPGNESNVTNDGKGRATDELLELPATGARGGVPFPKFLE